MKTSTRSSSDYHQRGGALRIVKRQSHSIDDSMGRIEKCKGDVQWVVLLQVGQLGVGRRNSRAQICEWTRNWIFETESWRGEDWKERFGNPWP